jgi:CubicO group peptidase (beta-lactamase class C family)
VSGLDRDKLASWLDDRALQHLFSGVVLVRSGGQTVFEHAAGVAHRGHGVPVTNQSRFQVASITKMVTATTALRMVERGSLSLHQPLFDFLPADLRPQALDERHTLHHLLSHTSGLPNYHDDEDDTWASFIGAWETVPVHHARGPKDILPLIADKPMRDELGEFVYGDANFILIGVLIEWVTGKSFAQVATEEVLMPMDLSDTGFDQLDTEPARMATPYLVTDEPPETWISNIYSVPAGGMPDGGMITTAGDLARFIESLQTGSIITPETFSLMLTPHGLEEDSPEGYGYGMELVVEDDVVTIYGHAGGDPGVSGMVSHYVGDDTTIVVLLNHDRGSWAATQEIAKVLGLNDPRE